eukprot:Lankesteria_metandrocarpae@DN4384_c0_g1_i2.p1
MYNIHTCAATVCIGRIYHVQHTYMYCDGMSRAYACSVGVYCIRSSRIHGLIVSVDCFVNEGIYCLKIGLHSGKCGTTYSECLLVKFAFCKVVFLYGCLFVKLRFCMLVFL